MKCTYTVSSLHTPSTDTDTHTRARTAPPSPPLETGHRVQRESMVNVCVDLRAAHNHIPDMRAHSRHMMDGPGPHSRRSARECRVMTDGQPIDYITNVLPQTSTADAYFESNRAVPSRRKAMPRLLVDQPAVWCHSII